MVGSVGTKTRYIGMVLRNSFLFILYSISNMSSSFVAVYYCKVTKWVDRHQLKKQTKTTDDARGRRKLYCLVKTISAGCTQGSLNCYFLFAEHFVISLLADSLCIPLRRIFFVCLLTLCRGAAELCMLGSILKRWIKTQTKIGLVLSHLCNWKLQQIKTLTYTVG